MRPRATVFAALALAAIGAPAAHGAPRLGPEALDGRFGSCGVREMRTSEPFSSAKRVAIAADGSAVVAGTAGPGDDQARILLQRLFPDGSVDPSFAGAGVNASQVPLAPGQPADDITLSDLAIAGDGKILVSGFVQDATERVGTAAILARFNVDGTPDGAFGSGGLVVERLQGSAAALADLAIAPSGKIVAAGERTTGSLDNPGVLVAARFNPDGSRDTAFGANGVAAPDLGDLKPTRANALRLLADGRILVGGRADEQFALARLTAAGELDRSFAAGGINLTSPPGSSSLTTMEVDGAGRIVAAGTASNINGQGQLALARYLPQGKLDPSFGAAGFIVDRRAFDPGASLALSSDGKILATGRASLKGDLGSGLLRYRASGKRDASFGAGGALALIPPQGSPPIETNDVVLAPDGTALAAQAVANTFTVARFVVGQPALAAIAQRPRICRLTVGAKTVARVVRTRSEGEPSLPTKLLLTRPAELRVEATVLVGGRRAKLETTTQRFEGAGSVNVPLNVPPSAVKLLRGAREAEVRVSARATDGGPVTTATRTLRP